MRKILPIFMICLCLMTGCAFPGVQTIRDQLNINKDTTTTTEISEGNTTGLELSEEDKEIFGKLGVNLAEIEYDGFKFYAFQGSGISDDNKNYQIDGTEYWCSYSFHQWTAMVSGYDLEITQIYLTLDKDLVEENTSPKTILSAITDYNTNFGPNKAMYITTLTGIFDEENLISVPGWKCGFSDMVLPASYFSAVEYDETQMTAHILLLNSENMEHEDFRNLCRYMLWQISD